MTESNFRVSKIPPYDLDVEPLQALERIEEWLREQRRILEGPGDAEAWRARQNFVRARDDRAKRPEASADDKTKYHAQKEIERVGQGVPGLRKLYPWDSPEAREAFVKRTANLAGHWRTVASVSQSRAQLEEAEQAASILAATADALSDRDPKRLALLAAPARKIQGKPLLKQIRTEAVRDLLRLLEGEIGDGLRGDDPQRVAFLLVGILVDGQAGAVSAELFSAGNVRDSRHRDAATWNQLTRDIAERFRARAVEDAGKVRADHTKPRPDAELYLRDALTVCFGEAKTESLLSFLD